MRWGKRWGKAVAVAAGLVATEVGMRVVSPSLNTQVVRDFFVAQGGVLIKLYDWLSGGALSRGAVLALGAMPYLSARIMLRLVGRHEGADSRRWTHWLTFSLALIQSFGFARFIQTIPGAVAHPGVGFVAQTMGTLTTGALFIMWLSERMLEPVREEQATPLEPSAEIQHDARLPLGVESPRHIEAHYTVEERQAEPRAAERVPDGR
jgi:preprotein translocase subunit SecY